MHTLSRGQGLSYVTTFKRHRNNKYLTNMHSKTYLRNLRTPPIEIQYPCATAATNNKDFARPSCTKKLISRANLNARVAC